MNTSLQKIVLLFFLGLLSFAGFSQPSITIEASQQVTNFVFTDNAGMQDNTYLMFGSDNPYKAMYSGAYNVGGMYNLDMGVFIRGGLGMRKSGATMMYDETNYQWDLQYFNIKLGGGYAYSMGMINPYVGVSGYYAMLFKAKQSINNEDFDIIQSESIEKSDFGILISPGVRIDASDFVSVYTEVGYLMGLKNIETSDDDQKAKNIAYQFTLGLAFTIE